MSIFKRKDPSVLQAQLKAFDKKGGFEADAAEWKPTQGKDGSGSAVIRFLPAVQDDAVSFVKVVNHGFQMNGKWYIENCPSTHGDWDSCPVCAWIKEQGWDYKNESDKQAMYATGTPRKTNYWANILVIKDPANPENDGKVFKFRFGKKILDKINAQSLVDTELGEESCDVTCPWEGKNFFLKLEKVGRNNNYDKSYFADKRTAIPNIDDEDYQKKLFGQMHDIMAIIAKDKFKSKADLEASFARVSGGVAAPARNTKPANAADDLGDTPVNKPAKQQAPEKNNFVAEGDSFDVDDLDGLLEDL